MSIQSDNPIQTIDSKTGEIVSQTTINKIQEHNKSNLPVKTVDKYGRTQNIETSRPIQTIDFTGKTVSETSNSETSNSETEGQASNLTSNNSSNLEQSISNQAIQTNDNKSISEFDLRKEYLETQRLKREAEQLKKQAKEDLSKAQAFRKARDLAISGEDPTALLLAADINPVKFYQDLTKFSLSDKGRQVETDPVKIELQEHKKRLESLQKELDEKKQQSEKQQELQQHNQIIQSKIIPFLQSNPEKYEVLLMHYGPNAAIEIYQSTYSYYEKTGKLVSFEQMADHLEQSWFNQLVSGHTNALKLKKYKERFAEKQQAQNLSDENLNTPNEQITNNSVTLSNKFSASTSPITKNKYQGLSHKEKAELIKKSNW